MHILKFMKIAEIDKMSGKEFETFIGDFFSQNKIPIIRTRDSGDFGADLLAEFNDAKFAIQCKRYNKPIGVSAIQEICASLSIYGATVGVVITNNRFAQQAKWLAATNKVILIGRSKLQAMLNGADIRLYLFNTKFEA